VIRSVVAGSRARQSRAAELDARVLACVACEHVADLATTTRKIRAWYPHTAAVAGVVVADEVPGPGRDVTTVLDLGGDSPTASMIVREVLAPLGIPREAAYVTSLVRCPFLRPPSELARERRVTVADILRPASARCLAHLEGELSALGIDVVVILGETAYELLCDRWGLAPGPFERAIGRPVPCDVAGRRVRLLPWQSCEEPQPGGVRR
jgi:hypothetical protein